MSGWKLGKQKTPEVPAIIKTSHYFITKMRLSLFFLECRWEGYVLTIEDYRWIYCYNLLFLFKLQHVSFLVLFLLSWVRNLQISRLACQTEANTYIWIKIKNGNFGKYIQNHEFGPKVVQYTLAKWFSKSIWNMSFTIWIYVVSTAGLSSLNNINSINTSGGRSNVNNLNSENIVNNALCV